MIRFVDRSTNDVIREMNTLEKSIIGYSIPCIDETVLLNGIRYQVASVVHDPDNEIITINMWKEVFVK